MSITTPKVQLLNQISEVDIIRFYVPGFDPESTGNYTSPFAKKDDHPSLNFYNQNGKLYFKSHNTGHQGDVFQFVADLKGIDCKSNFQGVISAIEADLQISAQPVSIESKKQSLKLSFDKSQAEMIVYFGQYGVTAETLQRFNVQQVKYHEFVTSIGKLCKFDYKKLNQLAVCYTIDERIKIYFPEIELVQTKGFGYKDQTKDDVFGLQQITGQRYERLFLAAGEKDCLVLNQANFTAISLQSENTLPSAATLKAINALSDNIFIVYDNDEPGQKAAEKLSRIQGWKVINLPDRVKDAAVFFQSHSKEEFEKLISEAKVIAPTEGQALPEVYTIFHQTEDFLKKYYDFRYNTVSLDIEYKRKTDKDFQVVNENQLFVTMNKAGIKVGMDKLICILKSDFVAHYNPVTAYFSNLPKWNGEDHIGNLAAHLHAEQPTQLDRQFRKWLVRCIRCALEPGYYNKQAFILVHSKQNSGKTTFCRFLCPPALSNYIAENISDDKDSRIALVKNFLINLDELSSLARHEINSLKALFSKDCINERLPYDRKNSIIPRIANFIGSTNMAEFLADETGSVRWLCFEIIKIDWNYKNVIDINQVWAQAYHMYKEGVSSDMNASEIAENESRNSKFQQRSTEAELIPKHLEPTTATDPNATFMTASDVLVYLTIHTPLKLNKVMIGRAMPNCGFIRTKDSKSDRYGYYCIKLNN